MEELGGVREISDRLGMSRQRVYQLTSDPGFPSPAFELEMGRIWFMSDIDEWNTRRNEAPREPRPEPGWVGRRSDAVMAALASAQDLVRGWRQSEVRLDHVLVAIVDQVGGPAADAIAHANPDMRKLREFVRSIDRDLNPPTAELRREIDLRPFSLELLAALEAAVILADNHDHDIVSTTHLLAVALDSETSASRAVTEAGAAPKRIHEELTRILDTDDAAEAQHAPMTSYTWNLPDGQEIRVTSPVDQPTSDVDKVRQLLAELAEVVEGLIETATSPS